MVASLLLKSKNTEKVQIYRIVGSHQNVTLRLSDHLFKMQYVHDVKSSHASSSVML